MRLSLRTLALASTVRGFTQVHVPTFASTMAFHSPVSGMNSYMEVGRSRLFSSTDGSPPGPDTSVVGTCTEKIKKALETDAVKVTGAYDDPNGSHIAIEVISELFEGKRAVQRQQLVYKAIWEEMQGAVHAVDSMICKAPSEV